MSTEGATPFGATLGYEWVMHDAPEERWKKLEAFVASFDHKAARGFDYVVVKRSTGEWIGYAQVARVPTVTFGWHPEIKPRELSEAVKGVTAWGKLSFGTGFTAVRIGHETFTPQVMARLGFRRLNLEIYEPI